MSTGLESVLVQCPGCSREETYRVDDEFIELGEGSYGMVDDVERIGSHEADEDITHFWAGFNCSSCSQSVKVVSFLADPSELSVPRDVVENRIEDLRESREIVEFEHPLVEDEPPEWEQVFYENALEGTEE